MKGDEEDALPQEEQEEHELELDAFHDTLDFDDDDDDDGDGVEEVKPSSSREEQKEYEEEPSPAFHSARRSSTTTSPTSSVLQYVDHFSLAVPSSQVRFRGNAVHVYDMETSQIQLVPLVVAKNNRSSDNDNDNPTTTRVELRHIPFEGRFALQLLRLIYTLPALFFAGILFVFSFQMILYLFMDMIVQAGLLDNGLNNKKQNVPKLIGTLLTLPLLVYGLAAVLAVATFFVQDIFQGSRFWHTMVLSSHHQHQYGFLSRSQRAVLVEVLFLLVTFGLPTLVAMVSLFAEQPDWWELTLLSWFLLMALYFAMFCLAVSYYELQASWILAQAIIHDHYHHQQQQQQQPTNNNNESIITPMSIRDFLVLAIMNKQNLIWSGKYDKVRMEGTAVMGDNENQQQQTEHDHNIQPADASNKNNNNNNDNNNTLRDRMQKATSKLDQVSDKLDDGYGPSRKLLTRCYTWCTLRLILCRCLFEPVNPPQRYFSTTQEVLGQRAFHTSTNWSLEQLFCRQRHSRSVTVIRRHNNTQNNASLPSSSSAALTSHQILANWMCVPVAIAVVMLLLLSYLVWLELPTGIIVLFSLILLCCCMPRLWNLRKMRNIIHRQFFQQPADVGADTTIMENNIDPNNNNNDDDATDEDDDCVYQAYEQYRISQPTKAFRWFMFVFDIGFLFTWPIVNLVMIGNWAFLGLFLVLALWTSTRYWLDPSCLVKEWGSLQAAKEGHETIPGDGANKVPTNLEKYARDEEDHVDENEGLWQVQSRVSTILLHVTTSPARRVWLWILILLVAVILILTIGTVGHYTDKSAQGGRDEPPNDNLYVSSVPGVNGLYFAPMALTPPGQFEYPPQDDNLQYPNCRLFKGLQLPGGDSTALADYVFLANVIYQAPETIQPSLDQWFGPGVARVNSNLTATFRGSVAGGYAAVDYEIITFGQDDDLSVVTVRGSSTSWEWLTDAQLWSKVAMVQMIQFLLPAGEMFNSILDRILDGMSFIESNELEQVSLYKQTTGLVNFLKDDLGYTGRIHITGHSLGGGIALITGAQTKIPAIAVSGPNKVWSRRTFDPPFDLDTIQKNLFNIIPKRDIVPRIDKPGLLVQHIECTARVNQLFDCHMATRTLCEIMYKCGSYNRPPPCECAVKYGYPDAEAVEGVNNGTSYNDVCGSKKSNDGWFA